MARSITTLTAVLSALMLAPDVALAELKVLIVEGLGGEERYVRQFAGQVDRIEAAARTLTNDANVRVFRSADAGRDGVLDYVGGLSETLSDDDRVIVYLIGHGSYDDHEYKFNIAGPDLTDVDIVDSLASLGAERRVLVVTSSASGALADKVEGQDLLLITATRSGVERHATRFGEYFAAALADPGADTDKNRIITAQEAFDFAERQVDDYFERNDRLATEHARMTGARADRISLARLDPPRPTSDDAELRELIATRDALAESVEALRLRRDNMVEDEYETQLLERMLELSLTEEALEERARELGIEQ